MGSLSSDDPDQPGGVHTYSIVGPAGVPFRIGGSNNRTLLVNGPLDHETSPTSLVIIRATDDGGLFIEKTFKIIINGESYMMWSLIIIQQSVSENKEHYLHNIDHVILHNLSKCSPLSCGEVCMP